MMFLSIGLPGRLAQLCDTVIERLTGTLGGSVGYLAWPSLDRMLGYHQLDLKLDDLALHLIQHRCAHLVVGVRQPDEGLRLALAEANRRFVLALEDPRHAAADLMAQTGADLRVATRAVANSCPLLIRYAEMPAALKIRTGDAENLRELAGVIADHLQISVTDAHLSELAADPVLTELVSAGGSAIPVPQLSEPIRKTLDGALVPYAEHFSGGEMGRFVWTRDLFMTVGDLGCSLSEPLQAAGGVRYLIYGPYIHLPPGSWNAQIVLGFSEEAAGHTFLVDACADRQIAATSFQPENPGIYTTEINFTLGEPKGHGLEIRVMVTSERARGQLAFGHVVLTPVAVRHADSDQRDFTAVLEL